MRNARGRSRGAAGGGASGSPTGTQGSGALHLHLNDWLANPATPAEVELREALDQGAAREADEVALRRVWSRLAETPSLVPLNNAEQEPIDQLARARGRGGRWHWMLAASLAGATATLAFMLIETKSEFRAGRIEQSHAGMLAGSAPSTAADGGDEKSTLVAPATVRTGFGETLHLSLRGGTRVTVTSESTLVLDQSDRPAVAAGEVQFQVPRQPRGQTFSVGAGSYRVVVVGTRFRVRVNHTNTAVSVDEGVVEIWTDHKIARIDAGESWVSPALAGTGLTMTNTNANTMTDKMTDAVPGAIGTAPPASPSDPRTAKASRVMARLNRASMRVVAAAPSANNAGSSAPAASTFTPSVASAPAPSAASAPITAGAAPRAPRLTVALSSPSSVRGAIPAANPPSTRPAAAAAVTAPPLAAAGDASPGLAPPISPVEVPQLTVQARVARAAGDPRRALGLYRALAEKGGAAGENAEYEMGRVLRDGLRQPRDAVAVWRAYRAQHPRGLLRIETDISIIETLVALGDKMGALAEASDFIHRYPDSERRAEIARLTGDLLRESGSCGDAIAAYDLALGTGRGRRDFSDGASFHRAVCLLRERPVEGSAALRVYLDAFPGGRFRGEAQRFLDASDPVSAPGSHTTAR